MDDVHPWETYQKEKLVPGFAYPIGRDDVEKALNASGATVDALQFSLPKLNPQNDPPIVIRIHWPGNSRPGYFTGRGGESKPWLTMWVDAVPSDLRAVIRRHLDDGALSRVCQWAADLTSDPSSPSLSGERELYLTWSGTELNESPTWPPRTTN